MYIQYLRQLFLAFACLVLPSRYQAVYFFLFFFFFFLLKTFFLEDILSTSTITVGLDRVQSESRVVFGNHFALQSPRGDSFPSSIDCVAVN